MSWLKRIGIVLAGLLVCFALMLTPWGTAFLLTIAEGVSDELSIEHESGGLLGTLKLAALQWHSDDIAIDATDVVLDIDWTCSLSFNVCVERVDTQKLTVNVLSKPQADNPPADPIAKITLPISVNVQQINIEDFNLNIDKQISVSWASLNTGFTFYESLVIDHFDLTQLQVKLPDGPENEPQAELDIAAISGWQYQVPELPRFVIPIDVRAKQLSFTEVFVFQGDAETFSFNKLNLDLSIFDNQIDITDMQLQHELASVQLKARVDNNYQVDLQLQAQSSQTQTRAFSLSSNIIGSPEQYEFSLTSTGILEATGDGKIGINSTNLPMQMNLSWSEFEVPTDQTIFIQQGKLSLAGNLEEYRLKMESGVSSNELPDAEINIDARGNNKAVMLDRALLSLLGGEIDINGRLALTDQASWNGQITAKDIQPNMQWPQLNALLNGRSTHSAIYSKDRITAELTQLKVQGTWQSFPVQVDASAKYDSSKGFTLSRSVMTTGDNQLLVSGTLNEQHEISAKADLKANDFSQLYATLQGSALGNAQLSGTLSQPFASYQLQAQQLKFENLALNALTSDGTVNWDENKTVEIITTFEQLDINEQTIESARIELSGTQDNHKLVTKIFSDAVNLDSLLVGKLSEHSWQGEWQSAEFQSAYGDYELSKPNTEMLVDWQNQRYQISPHCWQEDISKLCINRAQLVDEQIDVDIEGNDLALLQWINQFAPQTQRIESDTNLFFNIKGQWHKDALPVAQINGYLTPALINMEKFASPIDMQKLVFSGQVDGSTVNTRFELVTRNTGNVELELAILDIAENRNLQGQLSIEKFLLAPFAPFVAELSELSGEINGKLELHGTIKEPLLAGSLALNQVAIAGDAIPGKLEQWDQKIEFKNQSARMAGQFKFGGGVGQSDGEFDWSNDVIGHLNLSGEKVEIEYRDTVRAMFSPKIRLNLLADAIELGGNVDVLYARVKVKELPPSAQSPSDDEIIVNQPKQNKQSSSRPLRMAIQVNIDPNQMNDVKLDAFGLKADLRGSLELRKQKSLEGFGDLQLVNGTYQAYGQDLVIRTGDILFSGPMDNPQLNIEAIRSPEKTKDDVIAGIRVSGPAEIPQIVVFSEPAFNQSQTLSYLIRGQALEDQSAQNSNGQLLANALISAGLERGENRVDRLGRKLGIEDLTLGTASSDDGTRVSVSGYIAPGVQLIYGVNVFDSTSEISLRYQLLPKLYFEATSGVESALDLYYQFTSGTVEGTANSD